MRIRSIKPEFFDSPSTAKCSPWARLLYIAMWCMADDWGVGLANPKEMAANAFPNDDEITNKEIPSLCKEIADNYGVMFYKHRGRQYFQIPTWDDHQVTQRRAKRKHPAFDDPESTPDLGISELPSACKELPSRNKENASTEQGKKGTGEEGTGELKKPSVSSSEVADAPSRPEVEHLCALLADLVEANGAKRPTVTKRWRDAARLMIDRDGHSVEQIEWLIRWSQRDEFWRANILSMPKFRDKFDQLRLKATREHANRRPSLAEQAAAIERFYGEGDAA